MVDNSINSSGHSTSDSNEGVDGAGHGQVMDTHTDKIGYGHDSSPNTSGSQDAKTDTSDKISKRPVPRPRLSLDKAKINILKDRLITDPPIVPPRVPLHDNVITSPPKTSSEPLIKLDSKEFDPNVIFDPLSENRTDKRSNSTFYTSDVTPANSKFHIPVRSHPSRSSLIRSPAFKENSVSKPRRPGIKPDVILTEPASLETCGMSFFDPLSTSASTGSDNTVEDQHSTQSLSHDNALLHSWDMSSLLTSPSANTVKSPVPNAFSPPTPKPCQTPANPPSPIIGTTSPSSMNNPIYFTPPRPKISPRPRPRTGNQDTSLLGIIDNPLYTPPSSQKELKKEQQPSSSLIGVDSDPFGNLVNLSSGTKPSPPSTKWETFD